MGVALSRAGISNDSRIVPVFVREVDPSTLPPWIAARKGLHLKDLPIDEIASELAEVLRQDKIEHEA